MTATAFDEPPEDEGFPPPSPDGRVDPPCPFPEHRCQAIECMATVTGWRLMCHRHWTLVPESLKHTLFNLWDITFPWEDQPEYVQDFINMAVQEVAKVERKVMT